MMWALRAHYTMDMIAGIGFAHYFWILADKYSYLVDWHLLGIPLTKRLRAQGIGEQILTEYQLTELKGRNSDNQSTDGSETNE